jgi:hypothetical protein
LTRLRLIPLPAGCPGRLCTAVGSGRGPKPAWPPPLGISLSLRTVVSATIGRTHLRLFTMQRVFGDADGVCDVVGVEYVSRVTRPPLDG